LPFRCSCEFKRLHALRQEENLDYLLGGALSVALTAYLVYALLRPERF